MFLSYNNKNLKRLCMHRILLLLFFSLFVLYANENTQRKYNQNKTWKNIDASEVLEKNTKKLEAYYKQVDKQSNERNFVRFNGKKIISHTAFSKMNLGQMHGYRTYVILSMFYIEWISQHNDLDGVSVGGILADEFGDKKAKVRYFKFAQRYYSALHEIGKGGKVFSYCAAPYLTSCILIGIDEAW